MKVFICDCNGEIDIPQNLDFGDGVVVKTSSKLCSEEGKELIANSIKKNEKIVIAGCTPRIAEKFFAEFNPEYVNIREHVAYPGHADGKIRDLIKGAVEKVRISDETSTGGFEIKNKSALIIGGGVAGLETARQVASAGFKTYLIEKEPFLGGTIAKLDRLYPEGMPNSHTLYPLINEVVRDKNIEILVNSELKEISGEIGNYRATIRTRGKVIEDCDLCGKCKEVCPVTVDDDGIERKAIYYRATHPDSYGIDFENCTGCGKCAKVCDKIKLDETEIELDVGSIILATGMKEYDARMIKEYGYGKYKNVFTKLEFERKFANRLINPKKVVIVLCAGSRDENHLPYCSRVCCLLGLKEAKLIKDTDPEVDVYVTYIDLRSYGDFENLYTTVRETCGVNFIQGRPSEIVEKGDKLLIRTEDILLGKTIELDTDSVVLITGSVPDYELLEKLGIPSDGEFPVDYVNSSLSVDSNPRGIFVCGAAAFPKPVAESISEARDVAVTVINLLNKERVDMKTPVADINGDICSEVGCKICLDICPSGAIYSDGGIKVDPSMCMGCGVCTAACASGANQLIGYDDKGLLAQIENTVKEGDILAFLCKWSSYNAADKAGYEKLKYPENTKIIRIPCTGRVDAQIILKAFSCGVKGILIAGCPPDGCHYVSGNLRAKKRILATKELVEQLGIAPDSLRIEWIGTEESKKLVDILNEMDKGGNQ